MVLHILLSSTLMEVMDWLSHIFYWDSQLLVWIRSTTVYLKNVPMNLCEVKWGTSYLFIYSPVLPHSLLPVGHTSWLLFTRLFCSRSPREETPSWFIPSNQVLIKLQVFSLTLTGTHLSSTPPPFNPFSCSCGVTVCVQPLMLMPTSLHPASKDHQEWWQQSWTHSFSHFAH